MTTPQPLFNPAAGQTLPGLTLPPLAGGANPGMFIPPGTPPTQNVANALNNLNMFIPPEPIIDNDEEGGVQEAVNVDYDLEDPVLNAIEQRYGTPADFVSEEDLANIEVPEWLMPYVVEKVSALKQIAIINGRPHVRIPKSQVPHILRQMTTLSDPERGFPVSMNTTSTGGGKTLHTLFLIQYFGFDFGVICPTNAKVSWINQCNKYGMQPRFIMSYMEIGGKGWGPTKGNFLERYNADPGDRKAVAYRVTQDWMAMIGRAQRERITEWTKSYQQLSQMVVPPEQEAAKQQQMMQYAQAIQQQQQAIAGKKFMLIYDEFHAVKNKKTNSHRAGAALNYAIFSEPQSPNRVIELSATAFDKREHAESICRFNGFIRHQNLYNWIPATAEMQYLGIGELINACNRINPQATADVLRMYPIENGPRQQKRMENLVFYLFVTVIKTFISSSAPSPVTPDKVYNGFFDLGPKWTQDYERAAEALEATLGVQVINNQYVVTNEKVGLGTISPTLKKLELAIAYAMARNTFEFLEKYPTGKVMIAVHFDESREAVAQMLGAYHPLQIYGNTKLKERLAAVENFQKNPNARVIIINAVSGGVSIDLNPIIINAPHVGFISPFSYRFIAVLQTLGRLWRIGQASWAMAVMFYGASTHRVMKIMNAYAKKGKTTKATLSTSEAAKVKYPGDFPELNEAQIVEKYPELFLPFPTDQGDIPTIPQPAPGPIGMMPGLFPGQQPMQYGQQPQMQVPQMQYGQQMQVPQIQYGQQPMTQYGQQPQMYQQPQPQMYQQPQMGQPMPQVMPQVMQQPQQTIPYPQLIQQPTTPTTQLDTIDAINAAAERLRQRQQNQEPQPQGFTQGTTQVEQPQGIQQGIQQIAISQPVVAGVQIGTSSSTTATDDDYDF